MRKQSIKKNFLYNIILKLSNILFPIITFPYIARILSPDGIGRINFSIAFIQYFILVAQFGIPTYGIRECSKHRDDRKKLSKTVQEILIINLVMILLAYILLIIVFNVYNSLDNYKLLILIFSINIFGTSMGIEWFFQSIEEFKYITTRSVSIKLISVLSIFMLVKSSEDIYVYALISTLSGLLSFGINFLYANKYVDLFTLYTEYDFRRHVKPIFILFMMTISVSVYLNLDKVMLGFIVGDSYVGYYTIANKMIRIIVSIVTALGAVLLPRISYIITTGDNKEVRRILRKSLDFILMICVPAIAGIWVIAEPLIIVFAGSEYNLSIDTLQILSPLILIIAISNLIGIQVLVAYNKEKVTLTATVIGAIVNAILNYKLIPIYYHNGAAISSVIAEGIVTIIIVIGAFKFIKGVVNFKNLVIYITGATILLFGGKAVMLFFDNLYIKILVSILFGLSSYSILLLATKNEFVYKVFDHKNRKNITKIKE